MKKGMVYWIFGTAAVLAAGGIFVAKTLKSQKPVKAGDQPGAFTESTSFGSPSVDPFPLKSGSRGPEVTMLQKWLNRNGYASVPLVEDGIFGPKTKAAVIKMQAAMGPAIQLELNGIVTSEFFKKYVR